MKSEHFFIVGTERSGSSLLRSILGNHSEINIIPNDGNFFGFYDKFKGKSLNKKEKIFLVNRIKEKGKKLDKWNLDWGKIIAEVKKNEYHQIEDIIKIIWEEHWNNSKGSIKAFKKPYAELYFKLILSLYPDALFIAIIRDPRAVYASRKYYKRRDKTINFKGLLSIYKWNQSEREIRRMKAKLKNRVKIVKYENLVQSPFEIIKEICNFLGIQMIKGILNTNKKFEFNSNSSFEPSNIGNKKRVIYKSSVEKWRKKISNSEIRLVESQNKILMERENYNTLKPNLNLMEKINYLLLLMLYKGIILARKIKHYLGDFFRRIVPSRNLNISPPIIE